MKKQMYRTVINQFDVVFTALGSERTPRIGSNAGITLIDCVTSIDSYNDVFQHMSLSSYERKGLMYFSLPIGEFNEIVSHMYCEKYDVLDMRISPISKQFPNTAFFDGIKDENTEAFNIFYKPTSGGDVYMSDGSGLFHLDSEYEPIPEKGQGIGSIQISTDNACLLRMGSNKMYYRTSDKPDEVSSNIYVRPYPENGREMKLATIMKEISISH